MKNKYKVYILLTRSTTYFSRLIHFTTGDKYTHVSIGLDGIEGTFYSFSRRNIKYPLPAGFVGEKVNIKSGRKERIQFRLLEIRVTKDVHDKLQDKLNQLYRDKLSYNYNIIGVLTCYFGHPLDRKAHYFCSQFVAKLLTTYNIIQLEKEEGLVRPIDFCDLKNAKLICEGTINGLSIV